MNVKQVRAAARAESQVAAAPAAGARRIAARATPAPDIFEPASSAPVEICRGPAFGAPRALAEPASFMHWWIRHGSVEAGMGPDESTSDPIDVAIVDHSGLGDSAPNYCVPVVEVFHDHADVDPACVDRELTLGRRLGEYVLDGVCSDTVEEILRSCDPSTRSR